jgi:hypothetical protein
VNPPHFSLLLHQLPSPSSGFHRTCFYDHGPFAIHESPTAWTFFIRRYSARFSSQMPPAGIKLTCGNGSEMTLMAFNPPISTCEAPNGLRYPRVGRVWTMFESREKLEARKKPVNRAGSHTSGARFVSRRLISQSLLFHQKTLQHFELSHAFQHS